MNKTGDLPPTVAEYSGLQAAYEHFNAELFNGELPDVMIVLTRRAHSYGHFVADRFVAREGDDQRHELSLNPDMFFGRFDKEILVDLGSRGGARVAGGARHSAEAELSQQRLRRADEGSRPLPFQYWRARRQGDRGFNVSLHHPRRRFRAVVRTTASEELEVGVAVGNRRRSPRRQEEQDEIHLLALRCSLLGKPSGFPVCGACLVENHPDLTDVAELYRMIPDEPAEASETIPDLQAAE